MLTNENMIKILEERIGFLEDRIFILETSKKKIKTPLRNQPIKKGGNRK